MGVIAQKLADEFSLGTEKTSGISGLLQKEFPDAFESPVKSVAKSAAAGAVNLASGAQRSIPLAAGAVYDAAAIPQNLISKWLDIPELRADYDNIRRSKVNPISYFDQSSDNLDKVAKSLSVTSRYDDSITGYLGKGDYEQAGELLAYSVIENIPQLVFQYAATAAGHPGAALALLGASSAGSQFSDVADKENMTKAQKYINSFAAGGAEALFEKYGTQQVMERIVNGAGKEAMKFGLLRGIKAVFHNAGQEASEETLTQLSNNLFDRMTNNRRADGSLPGLTDGVGDSAIIGGVLGALMGGVESSNTGQRDRLVDDLAKGHEWNKATASSVVDRAARRKGEFEDNLVKEIDAEKAVSGAGLESWVKAHPAEAASLAGKTDPSRTDFDNAGLPRRPQAVRKQVADDVREILAAQKQEKSTGEPDTTGNVATAVEEVGDVEKQSEAPPEKPVPVPPVSDGKNTPEPEAVPPGQAEGAVDLTNLSDEELDAALNAAKGQVEAEPPAPAPKPKLGRKGVTKKAAEPPAAVPAITEAKPEVKPDAEVVSDMAKEDSFTANEDANNFIRRMIDDRIENGKMLKTGTTRIREQWLAPLSDEALFEVRQWVDANGSPYERRFVLAEVGAVERMHREAKAEKQQEPQPPAAVKPEPAKAEKQPWEMNWSEFQTFKRSQLTSEQQEKWKKPGKENGKNMVLSQWGDEHTNTVKQALSEGKPVPAEVLAEYPDLANQQKAEPENGYLYHGTPADNLDSIKRNGLNSKTRQRNDWEEGDRGPEEQELLYFEKKQNKNWGGKKSVQLRVNADMLPKGVDVTEDQLRPGEYYTSHRKNEAYEIPPEAIEAWNGTALIPITEYTNTPPKPTRAKQAAEMRKELRKGKKADVKPTDDNVMSVQRIVVDHVGAMNNPVYGGSVVSVPRQGEYYGTREKTTVSLMEVVASLDKKLIAKHGLKKFGTYDEAMAYAKGEPKADVKQTVPPTPTKRRRQVNYSNPLKAYVIEQGGLAHYRRGPDQIVDGKTVPGKRPEFDENRKLVSLMRQGGHPLDAMTDMAIRDGIIPEGTSADEFRNMLADATKPKHLSEDAYYKAMEENTAADKAEWLASKAEPVKKASLDVGDEYTQRGEKFEVLEAGDQALRIADGEEFWIPYDDASGVIMIDKGSLVKAESAPEAKAEPPPPGPAGDSLFSESELPFNLTQEETGNAKPKTTAPTGTETQMEMFDIKDITVEVDPELSANAAQEHYGTPQKALEGIRRQLDAVNADKAAKRAFTKEQRQRLVMVERLLEQRAATTPGDMAKNAVKHSVRGLGEAAEGLHQLFGGGKHLGAGIPAFSEETYAKAKPHFQKAYQEFTAAGKEVMEFLKWAVQEFGDGVRPYLIRFRDDLRKEKAAPPAQTGQFAATGLRRSVSDPEREALGFPAEVRDAARRFPELVKSAMNRLAQSSTAAQDLIAELTDTPRPLSDVEVAMLTIEKVKRFNERNAASNEIGKLADSGTVEEKEAARRRLDVATRRLEELFDVAARGRGKSITETARGLNAIRIMLDDQFSLVEMEQAVRDKQGGKELSGQQRAEIAKMKAEYDAAKAKLDAEIRRLTEDMDAKTKELAEAQANVVMAQLVAEVNAVPGKKSSFRVKMLSLADELDAKADKMLKELSGRTSAGVDPTYLTVMGLKGASLIIRGSVSFSDWVSKMRGTFKDATDDQLDETFEESKKIVRETRTKAIDDQARQRKEKKGTPKKEKSEEFMLAQEIKELMREQVEAGVIELGEAVTNVHQQVVEENPELTPENVRDLFSDYGKARPLSRDETARIMADLRRQAQLVASIEMVQKELAPLKSGPQRDKPSQKVRELNRKLNRLMRESGIRTTDENAQLASALAAKKTRMQNAIADLEKALADKKRIEPSAKTPVKNDPEADTIETKLKALREQYGAMFPPDPLTDEQRLDRAIKAAERSLDAITRQIMDMRSGKPAPAGRPGLPFNERLEQIRADRDAARAELNELRELAEPGKKAVEAKKRRIQAATKEVERRIRKKDFAPKERQEIDISGDPEAMAAQAEYENAKNQFAELKEQARRAARTPAEVAKEAGLAAMDAQRNLLASFDVSAVGRQGWYAVLSHPLLGMKATANMFRAFSRKESAKIEENLRNRPNYALYQQAKLGIAEDDGTGNFTRVEDRFRLNLVAKFPGINLSNRAYATFLNTIRADMFDQLLANSNAADTSREKITALAEGINEITGRGNLGRQNPETLARYLWAPRFLKAAFDILTLRPLRTGTKETRIIFGKEYMRAAASMTAIYLLANLFRGDDDEPIELDPRSSDFGAFSVGNEKVNPLGFARTLMTFLARNATGVTVAGGEKRKLRERMTFLDKGAKDVQYRGGMDQVWLRFAQAKAHPSIDLALAGLSGKEFGGKDITPVGMVKDATIPLASREVFQIASIDDPDAAVALSLMTLFGVDVKPDYQSPEYLRFEAKDEAAFREKVGKLLYSATDESATDAEIARAVKAARGLSADDRKAILKDAVKAKNEKTIYRYMNGKPTPYSKRQSRLRRLEGGR